ncbi:hypothetical protein J2T55_000583 [Methylohalomonas lacus]|uniref:Uncharacterized protein n=1 Tax=Methylohalomonas lacus TaxID=398773 RepID=A0AAE3HK63_9GAMM|nr:hypothetical protein [Methylohalomonas lacus]
MRVFRERRALRASPTGPGYAKLMISGKVELALLTPFTGLL